MKKHIKSLLQQAAYLKWIPNALTLGNSLCGFAAILNTLQVYEKMSPLSPAGLGSPSAESIFAVSALMILCAMVFDALDGFAARLLNAASLHGIQMDSLADMVTFGVAPAALVAVMAHYLDPAHTSKFLLVWGLSAVYLGCAALRLAKYNVHAMLEKKSSDKFSGLPSPGAAAAVCSLIFLFALVPGQKVRNLLLFLPYYAAILGFLMVSTVPYQHFGKWLVSVPKNRGRLGILLLLLAALLLEILLTKKPPVWVMAVLINGYILWSPVKWLFRKIFFREEMEA